MSQRTVSFFSSDCLATPAPLGRHPKRVTVLRTIAPSEYTQSGNKTAAQCVSRLFDVVTTSDDQHTAHNQFPSLRLANRTPSRPCEDAPETNCLATETVGTWQSRFESALLVRSNHHVSITRSEAQRPSGRHGRRGGSDHQHGIALVRQHPAGSEGGVTWHSRQAGEIVDTSRAQAGRSAGTTITRVGSLHTFSSHPQQTPIPRDAPDSIAHLLALAEAERVRVNVRAFWAEVFGEEV